MRTATSVTLWIVRLAGVTQIVLGLWALAALAARAGSRPALVALAVVWGLVLPIYGVMHARLLPGSAHWVVQVVHLLLGIGALRLAEGLAAHVRRRTAPAPGSAYPSAALDRTGAPR